MSLQDRTLYWLVCDGCKDTYGDDEGDLMEDWYEDSYQLREDAKADGWTPEGSEAKEFSGKWFCEVCSIKEGLVPLTPIQQAVLMHGKGVVFS